MERGSCGQDLNREEYIDARLSSPLHYREKMDEENGRIIVLRSRRYDLFLIIFDISLKLKIRLLELK